MATKNMAKKIGNATFPNSDPFGKQGQGSASNSQRNDTGPPGRTGSPIATGMKEPRTTPQPPSQDQGDEWDASKTLPSRFGRRKGSLYATAGTRDAHGVGRNYDRDEAYHAKLAERGWGDPDRRGSRSSRDGSLTGNSPKVNRDRSPTNLQARSQSPYER